MFYESLQSQYNPSSLGPYKALTPQVGYFARRWRSAGTLEKFKNGYRKIIAWSKEFDVPPFPIGPAMATEMVANEAHAGRSLSACESLRYSISALAKANGDPDPTEDYHFKRVMLGIHRELGTSNPNRKIARSRGNRRHDRDRKRAGSR